MLAIQLWKWEYTDESGKRCVSRWLMTEHEALRYKDAVRLEHTRWVHYDMARPPERALRHGSAP
jgi:hypothetical protein